MAEFVTGFQTAQGVKKYDYNSLGNLPESTGWTYEQVKLLETILNNVMWTNDNNGAAWIGTVNKLIYSLLGNSYDPQAPDENGVLTLVSAPMNIDSDGILTLE